MRSLFAAFALLAFASTSPLVASEVDYAGDKDVQTLLKTVHFGFGPLFLTSSKTEGEAALNRILKKDDALKYLFPVFDSGTPEGKCYALVGFHILAPSYFESSCKRLARWESSKINTVAGCLVGGSKLAEVMAAIRADRYDDDALGKTRD